ncbi:hypothetical protein ACYOEI_15485 [Singulisphaera rosea]
MGRLQISIMGLILTVVVAATAFAALRIASNLWFSVLYTATAGILLIAVIAARLRRGSQGTFWFGFSVFGWGFFLLSMGPWAIRFEEVGGDFSQSINQYLLSSRVIEFIVPRIRAETDDLEAIDSITANTAGIIHLFIVLAVATCGGMIAVLLKPRRRAVTPSRGTKPGSGSKVIAPTTIFVGLLLGTLSACINTRAQPTESMTPNLGLFGEPAFHRPEAPRNRTLLGPEGEPTLASVASSDHRTTAYQLIWLPTFNHPVCVRIRRTGDIIRLRAVVLDGRGGYDFGKAVIDRNLTLTIDQWNTFEQIVAESDFWNLPTREVLNGGMDDGDELTIEGVKARKYHRVDRIMPDPSYTELCRLMLELTGLKTKATWEGYHPPN